MGYIIGRRCYCGFQIVESEAARMTDNVGRQRLGRDSVAHASARQERVVQPTRRRAYCSCFVERRISGTTSEVHEQWEKGLAYLFKYLDKASRPRCKYSGGYNCLFQA
ncbi:hypothetical protein P8452_28052 [Trifolium repens]|nr:hypothetical protein P8452_28052 [Trifolium repens]